MCLVVKVNADAAPGGARVLSRVAVPPARAFSLVFCLYMTPKSLEKTVEVFSGDSGTTPMFLLMEAVGIVD